MPAVNLLDATLLLNLGLGLVVIIGEVTIYIFNTKGYGRVKLS